MNIHTLIKISTWLYAGALVLGGPALCAAGFYLVVYRFGNAMPSAYAVAIRLPQADARPKGPVVPVEAMLLTTGDGKPSSITASWSMFRGDLRDGIYHEDIRLQRSFPSDEGPKKLWTIPLGEGYAGAAVKNGCVYIIDYDMENLRDAMRCLSLDDGKEIWRFSYPVKIKKNHGMSRTIPAVTEKYCVAIGPKCHVSCVDAITGEKKWFIDLQNEYGTLEPQWYAGQCPLIVDGAAIIAPAGPEVLVMAIDCETGEERWRTPNPFGWEMTHVSLTPMTLDGKLTYIYVGDYGVAGIDAADGTILWSTEEWYLGISAACPSPVVVPDNRVFLCAGYRYDSAMLQVLPDTVNPGQNPGKYVTKTLFRIEHQQFGSEQQTPILYDNHLFGIRQNDKQFVCLDLNGNVVWQSGTRNRFGSGPYLLADGMFLILDDNAKLTACEATTSGFKKIFDAQILDDSGAWAPMALVAGRLILRDQKTMTCLQLE